MSFSPPPYPYARLDGIRDIADQYVDGALDCSIGTPGDEPPPFVLEALARATGARGYPSSAGSPAFREAAAHWLARTTEFDVDAEYVAACVGTKEFVASLAGFLHLRDDTRDTVLYPEVSYPTYAMGATLAGLRAVAVPLVEGRMDLSAITAEDRARALVLWTNSPSNPTGVLEDLGRVAEWGRRNGVVVASDECYAPFTWTGRPRSILESGTEGVLAVHSISKRSNLAGLRAGFYAGDLELVKYLRLVRQHAGLMVPGPVQAAVAVAYDDDNHVAVQGERYRERLGILSAALAHLEIEAPMPQGAFYLWCRKDGLDGWALAELLAREVGLVTSPGEFYGTASQNFVRIAVVHETSAFSARASRLR